MALYLDSVLLQLADTEHPFLEEPAENWGRHIRLLLVFLAAGAEYAPADMDTEVTQLREAIEQLGRERFGYEPSAEDRKAIRSIVQRTEGK